MLKVRAIDGFFGAWKFGSRPWNTASLGNRSRLRWVLIEKPRGIRFLAVSSDDPIAFAQALDVQR